MSLGSSLHALSLVLLVAAAQRLPITSINKVMKAGLRPLPFFFVVVSANINHFTGGEASMNYVMLRSAGFEQLNSCSIIDCRLSLFRYVSLPGRSWFIPILF